MYTKASLVAVCAALIVAGAPAGAAERSPNEVCAMFPHAQTYRAQTGYYRAPAWHYGGTVTVRYNAASCTVTASSIHVSGTALVYHVPGIAEILVLARLASTGANQELADRVVGLFEDDG